MFMIFISTTLLKWKNQDNNKVDVKFDPAVISQRNISTLNWILSVKFRDLKRDNIPKPSFNFPHE